MAAKLDLGAAVGDAEFAKSTKRSAKTIDEKNAQGNATLAVAKDRAQTTATTAMSVVHVALLKSVLDNGPDNQEYYIPLLVLIVVSLTLQVLVGGLSIYVAHIRSYHAKFSGSLCDDLWNNLCCCKVVDDRDRFIKKDADLEERKKEILSKTNGSDSGIIKKEITPSLTSKLSKSHTGEDGTAKHTHSGLFKCCCCWCTTQMYDEEDYEIMELYEHWLMEMPKSEMDAAHADGQLKYIIQKVASAKAKIEELKTAEGERKEELIKEAESELQDANEKRSNLEQSRQVFISYSKQGDVLTKYAKAATEKRVLKMVTFWQNIINYMLYTVFILNMFITGLGLAPQGAANPATEGQEPPGKVQVPATAA